MSIGPWQFSTFAGVLILFLVMPHFRIREYSWKLLFIYLGVLCIYGGFFDPEGPHTSVQLALQATSLRFLVAMVALVSFFKVAEENVKNFVKDFFLAVLVADALFILVGGPGIMIGTTLDTLVMAIFLPLWFEGRRTWCLPMVLGAIFKTVGMASFVALFIHSFLWTWNNRRGLAMFVTGGLLALLVLIPRFTVAERLMPRIRDAWSPTFAHWVHHGNFFVGFGPWSFQWLAVSEKIGSWPMLWVHNDWLQILFELGAIGLSLSLIAYARTLWLVRADARAFSIMVCLGFGMFVYSPLQYFVVQYLMFYVVLRSTNKLTKVDAYPKVGLATIPSEEC
jgi:hypothetical protein